MTSGQEIALCLALACSATGCAPADDTGPQTVRVFAIEAASGEYGLVDERLETLTSARHVRGTATRMRGGGQMLLESAVLSGDLEAETEEELRNVDLINGDSRVEAAYERDAGVLVPLDWESLQMFSFYHHLERSQSFYAGLGVSPDAMPPLRTFFNVRFTSLLAWGLPLVSDNAGYAPVFDAFLLFPTMLINDGVPLAMNQGVVAHELMHATKHHLLHGDNRLPIYLRDAWPDEAVNSYRSDDEGLADFFAAVFTDDPDFIAASIDSQSLDRDLAVERDFTQAQHDLLSGSTLEYDPYPLGSMLASWLWATAGDLPDNRRRLALAVVAALSDLPAELDADYRITRLIDAIVNRAAPDLAARGCDLLDERLQGDFREVPACGI